MSSPQPVALLTQKFLLELISILYKWKHVDLDILQSVCHLFHFMSNLPLTLPLSLPPFFISFTSLFFNLQYFLLSLFAVVFYFIFLIFLISLTTWSSLNFLNTSIISRYKDDSTRTMQKRSICAVASLITSRNNQENIKKKRKFSFSATGNKHYTCSK
jgi:hypothetical protein